MTFRAYRLSPVGLAYGESEAIVLSPARMVWYLWQVLRKGGPRIEQPHAPCVFWAMEEVWQVKSRPAVPQIVPQILKPQSSTASGRWSWFFQDSRREQPDPS
jgi:hypothetical protein